MNRRLLIPEILGVAGLAAFLLARFTSVGAPDRRPYEFIDANRTVDDHAPFEDFEGSGEWIVSATNAVASFAPASDEQLFGARTGRLVYRGRGAAAPRPFVRVRPAEPKTLPSGWDVFTVWVHGTRWGMGANKETDTPSPVLALHLARTNGTEAVFPLGTVHWRGWHLLHRRLSEKELKGLDGAAFAGFSLAGGTQSVERAVHFDNAAFFKEELRPLAFTPRAKRPLTPLVGADQGLNTGAGTLPFPVRDDTIIPPTDRPGAGDLLAQFAGGEAKAAEKGRLRVATRRVGRSLVVDLTAEAGAVTEVTTGLAVEGRVLKRVALPYYSLGGGTLKIGPDGRQHGARPFVDLLEGGWYRFASFDWYRSNASELQARETPAGTELVAVYRPKTDGTFNPVCERIVVTLSREFADVLPVIANPVSPWKRVTGTRLWRAHASHDRAQDREIWRTFHRHGVTEMIVEDHETCFRDTGESFTFRTKAAPGKGGDEGLRAYARFMRDELGYLYGPYNNFTDYAPVNANWDPDGVSRRPDGEWQKAWMRCWAPKPARAVEFCARLSPELQAKFGFSTAYCDVHTAVTPWSRTDYDARVPGAGTFAATYYAYGEIMQIQKRAWGGPVYSEGGVQALYAGLTDGNYAQDRSYGFDRGSPWLVDFALRRIHPLECDFGMGNLTMFSPPTTPLQITHYLPNATGHDEESALVDRFLACTLAFGHAGFFVMDFCFTPPKAFGLAYSGGGEFTPARGMDLALRSYYMVQQIAARYTQVDAAEIAYVDEQGRRVPTSAAVADGTFARRQTYVRYADGTVVVVNGNPTARLRTNVAGRPVDLCPYGYAAWTACGDVEVESNDRDGRRFDYCASPAYVFVDGRGTEARCARARAKGQAVCRAVRGGWEVIPVGNAAVEDCAFLLPRAKDAPPPRARALDFAGKDVGAASVEVGADGFVRLRAVKGAFSYRVQ